MLNVRIDLLPSDRHTADRGMRCPDLKDENRVKKKTAASAIAAYRDAGTALSEAFNVLDTAMFN